MHGLRESSVVELSTEIAGAYATKLLAHAGVPAAPLADPRHTSANPGLDALEAEGVIGTGLEGA